MLTPSRFAVLARLYEEAENAASAVVTLHNKLLEEAIKALQAAHSELDLYGQYRTCMMHEGTIVRIDIYGVDVTWEEYARGCRTDSGSYSIPHEALCEATRKAFLEDKVATRIAAIKKDAKGKANRERAWKRAELERLKRELGE